MASRVSKCADFAAMGNLAALQTARISGYPWDTWTCTEAAASGHLKVLRWARKNGCPWDSWACSEAAAKGHLHVLQYLYNERAPYGANHFIHNDECRAFMETHGESWRSRSARDETRRMALNKEAKEYCRRVENLTRNIQENAPDQVAEWLETIRAMAAGLEPYEETMDTPVTVPAEPPAT